MLRITDLQLPLDHSESALRQELLARLDIAEHRLRAVHVFRRAFDARKKNAIQLVYTLDVEVDDEAAVLARSRPGSKIAHSPDTTYQFVARAPRPPALRPIVIGFGPCGLFAALILAQSGFCPLIIERGKPVRERTKDTFGLWRKRELHPESNVQFGEGGAGTFSDGKLWTQVSDPKHYGRKVLEEFVKADAPPEILYVSKPHIGTFRLVKMIEIMRENIIALGGEFRFEQKVEDIEIDHGQVRAVLLSTGERIAADHVVLAVGHSARDTFQMLHRAGVNERNANAGIVVGITPADYPGGPLSGIDFQRELESRAFVLAGGNYNAPGQLVGDFLAERVSAGFGAVLPSYQPGVTLCDLGSALPEYAISAIREALPAFDRQIRGFAMEDAVLTGVETRTSSPVRIRRGEDFQSMNTRGLYPAGEGAGYAGGIMSAAIDGIRVAESVALSIHC
jgi:uncharacterized FAD-dependent dehydrogenase